MEDNVENEVSRPVEISFYKFFKIGYFATGLLCK